MRWSWLMCAGIIIWPVFAVGQSGKDLISADVFSDSRTALGLADHPSASVWLSRSGGSLTVENSYGTGIMAYQLAVAFRNRNNGWVFSASRTGTPVLHRSNAVLSWSKALSPDLGLSLGMGYASLSARGYGNMGSFSTGLGLGWRLTDRFTWLLQVNDMHALFDRGGPMFFEVRSGVGYRFSEACVGFVQVVTGDAPGTALMVGLEYRPEPHVLMKLGYTNDLFLASAGYDQGRIGIQVFTSWHMALGLSQGLALVCKVKGKE